MDWTKSGGRRAEQSPRASEHATGGQTTTKRLPNLLNSESQLCTAEQVRASPSRKHGISEVLEDDYRRKTCLFIKAAGKALDLPVEGVATAVTYFHKFFMLHSFKEHERFVVASACIFLAAKVEESGKGVDKVVSKCHGVWTNWQPFSDTEKSFKRLREKVLIAERCVLHTISFRMSVEHPYATLLELLKALFANGWGAARGKGCSERVLNRRVHQAAQSFVNDSLLTTLCLRYRPFDIAASVVYLSYLFVGLPHVDTTLLCLRRGESGILQTDEFVVADICDTILALYDEDGAGHVTAVARNLRDALQRRINSPSIAATAAPSTFATPSPRPTPSPSRQTCGGGNPAPPPVVNSVRSGVTTVASSESVWGTPRSKADAAIDTAPTAGLPSHGGAVASGGSDILGGDIIMLQSGINVESSDASKRRQADERRTGSGGCDAGHRERLVGATRNEQ